MLEDNLAVLRKVSKDVLDPARLLLHNVLSSAGVFDLPLIDELARVTDLGRHTRNAKLSERPVVLVAANSEAHDLLACALERSVREGRVLANLREDL